ncbi:MAG: MFS transporter [Hyphomicrobiaceae bacterium]|nr:MFS transporter [Hyphomicrobiaceae bacterium]
MYDWAAQPFYTLITTFLFAPYFANSVYGDKVAGQAAWGYAAAVAGVFIAVGSPFLGALADGRGRRKPWLALFAAIFIGAQLMLWFAKPGASQTTIMLVLLAFVVAAVAAEYAQVFTNAIMPSLVPHGQLGRLSGAGWAAGYFGGLASLIIMVGLIAPVPETGKTLLGLTPLIALDTAAREGDRLAGPFAALWFLIFVIPFFLFVPDKPSVRAVGMAERSALAELWDTLKSLPRNIILFLAARMLYSDGLSAIFVFGGIYGAAVFGWGPVELGIFGIVLSVFGALGAVAGGYLDDWLGSKAVIVGALVALMVGAVGILSVDATHVFFATEVAAKAKGSAPFSSVGEQVFLGFAILVGLVSAPVQASSRSLLARLAPPDKVTQYFGLFAFSGKATAFAAPLLVAIVTGMTDQRIGMASILVFLIMGAVMMLGVRTRQG